MAVELLSMLQEAFRFYSLTTDGLCGRTRNLQGVDSLKKSDSELGMDEDITRRNLIHDAGLAALGLSLHFEFRELPECLLLLRIIRRLPQPLI